MNSYSTDHVPKLGVREALRPRRDARGKYQTLRVLSAIIRYVRQGKLVNQDEGQ
jgi:hypothetical protein